jgi:hypothetical protein
MTTSRSLSFASGRLSKARVSIILAEVVPASWVMRNNLSLIPLKPGVFVSEVQMTPRERKDMRWIAVAFVVAAVVAIAGLVGGASC